MILDLENIDNLVSSLNDLPISDNLENLGFNAPLFDDDKERQAIVRAYERFRKTGKAPLGAFTDRDKIKPVGVNLKDYYANQRAENLQQMIDIYNYEGGRSVSQRSAKAKRKKRILDKALTFKKFGFITITLNDEWLNYFITDRKSARRKLVRLLKTCGITRYEFLADYGKQNKRLHFHGVVDLENAVLRLVRSYSSKTLYNIDALSSLGFNSCIVPYNITNDVISKEVAYMVKYMSKELEDEGLTHWRIGSKY